MCGSAAGYGGASACSVGPAWAAIVGELGGLTCCSCCRMGSGLTACIGGSAFLKSSSRCACAKRIHCKLAMFELTATWGAVQAQKGLLASQQLNPAKSTVNHGCIECTDDIAGQAHQCHACRADFFEYQDLTSCAGCTPVQQAQVCLQACVHLRHAQAEPA